MIPLTALIAGLIGLLLWSLKESRRILIHPAVLICLSFLISALGLLLYLDWWEITFTWTATFFTLTMTLIFCLGTFIGQRSWDWAKTRITEPSRLTKPKIASLSSRDLVRRLANDSNISESRALTPATTFTLAAISMVLLGGMFWVWNDILYLSSQYNGAVKTDSPILRTRLAITHQNLGFSRTSSTFMRLSQLSALVAAYVLISAINNKSWKRIGFPALILLEALALATFTGARLPLIRLTLAIGILASLAMYRNTNFDWRRSFKTVLLAGGTFATGVIAYFLVSGIAVLSRVGDNRSLSSISNNVFMYISGGLGSLPNLLDNPVKFDSGVPAGHTLINLYGTLKSLGFPVSPPKVFFPMTSGAHDFSVNVYTAYGIWYADFGWIGAILWCFVSAALIGLLFQATKTTPHVLLAIFYGFIGAALILFSFDDLIFRKINDTIAMLILALPMFLAINYLNKIWPRTDFGLPLKSSS